jgi:hypothetical protein
MIHVHDVLQSSWTQLYSKGDLVELDLTFLQGIQTNPNSWVVAAHVLHKYKRDVSSDYYSFDFVHSSSQ